MKKGAQEIANTLNRLAVSTISKYTRLYADLAKAWISKALFQSGKGIIMSTAIQRPTIEPT
jgi:hypothetical protein